MRYRGFLVFIQKRTVCKFSFVCRASPLNFFLLNFEHLIWLWYYETNIFSVFHILQIFVQNNFVTFPILELLTLYLLNFFKVVFGWKVLKTYFKRLQMCSQNKGFHLRNLTHFTVLFGNKWADANLMEKIYWENQKLTRRFYRF